MNIQLPTKRNKTDGTTLLVHSIFSTFQGEGPFTGVPAIFVRLGGCNLQCPGCDTEYTEGAQDLGIFDIAKLIRMHIDEDCIQLVVITGGEPFRQNLAPLINMLHSADLIVQIETNGSMAPMGVFITYPVVVCSPKTTKLNPKMERIITAYKYVLDYMDLEPRDGLPTRALGHSASPHIARPPIDFDGDIYLQPMDATCIYDQDNTGRVNSTLMHNKKNLEACMESCKKNGYILQLQIHKIINVE